MSAGLPTCFSSCTAAKDDESTGGSAASAVDVRIANTAVATAKLRTACDFAAVLMYSLQFFRQGARSPAGSIRR